MKNSDWMFLQCNLNVVDGVLGGVDRHCPGVDLLNFVAFVAIVDSRTAVMMKRERERRDSGERGEREN